MEQRDNSGVFFPQKKGDDKRPGELRFTFGGEQYRIAYWKKTDKNGNPWYSFNIETGEREAPASRASRDTVPTDADIPF